MKLCFKGIVVIALIMVALPAFAGPRRDVAYPSRDITVVVPWGAGGASDLTVRLLAEGMHRELGVNMPVINMGGAGGSIGMNDVFTAPRNGYRILGTSMASLVSVGVMDLAPIRFNQWYAWNAAFTPSTIVVRRDSPFQTIDDLIAAMRAGTVTMGSAGPGSSGHIGGVVFAGGAGVSFTHIPYEGGSPAIIATLGGEVDFNAQLLSELIDHIRSGDLRALASLAAEDITVVGAGGQNIVIPSIRHTLPNLAGMLPVGGSFGIMVPRDTPREIVDILSSAYAVAVRSAAFRDFAAERGKIVLGYTTEQTDAYLSTASRVIAWTLADAGLAVVSPTALGIPRP